jgi:hypothetical protein
MLASVSVDESDEPYRAAPPLLPDPYLLAWARLRRRQRAAQFTMLGMIPIWFLCATARYDAVTFAILPMACVFVATAFVTRRRLTRFPCPGCLRPFVWSRRFKNDLRCWHCGLKFGTPAPSRSDVRGEQGAT